MNFHKKNLQNNYNNNYFVLNQQQLNQIFFHINHNHHKLHIKHEYFFLKFQNEIEEYYLKLYFI